MRRRWIALPLALIAFTIGAASVAATPPADGDDWPLLGGSADRNMVSATTGLATSWGEDGTNVLWSADLGDQTYSNPAVGGDWVIVGTNNGKPRDAAVEGDKGILMAFSRKDGSFLWQAVHDKLETGDAEDWANIGICSSPQIVGDRVYYVSNRAELVCADANGFHDDENDGPFEAETRKGKTDADIVWVLDMRKELGASPYQASASSPLVVGDLVFVVTGQGVDDASGKVKKPDAPSFIAVNRKTGKVVWQDASPGEKIIQGQWTSPAYAVIDGTPQVCFPGGDGWIYAFAPETGKLLWKFDGNAHEEGEEPHTYALAAPVYAGHRLIVALGTNPEEGAMPGCIRAVDARKRGDVTKTAELWRRAGDDFGTSISTVAVHDGLVYAVELDGFLHCLELETGKAVWKHDLMASVWGSPLVADGKLWVRNGEGELLILALGREAKELGRNELPDLYQGSPVAAGGVLYLAADTKLFAIKEAGK